MTEELKKIFEQGKAPKMRVVDYSTAEKRKELKALIQKQREILKRREVNWQRLNSFVIKL